MQKRRQWTNRYITRPDKNTLNWLIFMFKWHLNDSQITILSPKFSQSAWVDSGRPSMSATLKYVRCERACVVMTPASLYQLLAEEWTREGYHRAMYYLIGEITLVDKWSFSYLSDHNMMLFWSLSFQDMSHLRTLRPMYICKQAQGNVAGIDRTISLILYNIYLVHNVLFKPFE